MASLTAQEARRRFLDAAVARLATVSSAGHPHLVPVTFASGSRDAAPGGVRDTIVSAIDHKPKRTTALARLAHIAANPTVSLLVDHYEDDWTKLWWARADGHATTLHPEENNRVRNAAISQLAAKYPQYVERPPQGPVIVVSVVYWVGWSGAEEGIREVPQSSA